jgi:uncharacterized membrane protein
MFILLFFHYCAERPFKISLNKKVCLKLNIFFVSTISILGNDIKKEHLYIGILTILYTVGIVGLLGDIHPQFIYLTPINLLVSTGLLLPNHPKWLRSHIIFCVLCFMCGFLSEVMGVQTGIIFGEYAYGDVLGFKIWDTPLMIGINWLMLVYASSVTANHLLKDKAHTVAKALIAAGGMVILDVLIEPVAIVYGFWEWEAEHIPLQNYLAWFVIAFVLCWLFQKMIGNIKNKVAVALFILQFVFFAILGMNN